MPKFRIDNTLPKNLPLLFKDRAKANPDVGLQASKDKDGKFQTFTYQTVYQNVIAFALALQELGVVRGENIALISDNRREWLITDLAVQSLGCADVPRGCDSLGNEIRFIISFADCRYGFFENARQLKKVTEKIEEVPLLKTAIVFEPLSKEDEELMAEFKDLKIYNFEELLKMGEEIYAKNPEENTKKIEAEMELTQPDDNATVIFTSGTTGTPKGVMLTHKNYTVQLSAIYDFIKCKRGDWWMSILPVWHSFERLIQYVAIYFVNGLAYSKPVASILLGDMAVIRPQWICGVPRLWEALANGVNKAMNKKGGVTLKLFNFFISVGKSYANAKDKVLGHVCQVKKRNKFLDALCGFFPMIFLWPLRKLGDALVFKKIRDKFGGRISIAISGGGALQKDVDDFYRAIGLNLLEGYGLTETAPVISFRYYKEPRPGCVGAIFPSMEVKIIPEENGVPTSKEGLGPGKKGLIFVRSAQVMKGYYKRPDLTEKIIDEDGWLNTGDLGLLTFDNEIKITGRAKDTIVLLGGENIEPAVIESELNTSPYIETSIVLGQDQKYLGALIVPSKENVIAYAKENNLDTSDYEELLKTKEIIDLLGTEIKEKDSTENGFRVCEKIWKFALLPNSFTVGEELSAKQEMMRHKIVTKYADIISTLFEN